MDHHSGSSIRCSSTSSMVSSLPEDSKSLETSSEYSSPVSVTSSHGRNIQPAIGLGISRCGLEPSFDNMRGFSIQPTFSMTSPLSSHHGPEDTLYGIPIKANAFSEPPCFGIYNGLSETAPPTLRYCDSQNMSTSPNCASSIENPPLRADFSRQAPGYWTPAACSGPRTPPNICPIPGGPNMGYWGPQCITETYSSISPSSSTLPCGLQLMGSSFPSSVTTVANNEAVSSREALDPSLSLPQQDRAISEEKILGKGQRVSQCSASSPTGRKLPSSKGYACRICGYTFTRRSNCVEHEKKHDPNNKRSFPCEECHKTFGRNADLKRHTDTIHRGIRKYGCTWCDRRFLRLDVLNKHYTECSKSPLNSTGYEQQYSSKATEQSWMAPTMQ